MNIYEKINKIRVELQGMELKKSGKNAYSKYSYYELADFLPAISQKCKENNIICLISFDECLATMTIKDIENKEEEVTFTSPMSKAELKGCHEVQNLGAVHTYLRRYLYMLAFEIVESDLLDSGETTGKKKTQNKSNPGNDVSARAKAVKTIKELCEEKNQDFKEVLGVNGVEDVNNMTSDEYKLIVAYLKGIK